MAAQLAAKLAETVPTAAAPLDPVARHHQQEEQRLRKVYIGNLPRELNDTVLRAMFEPFGTVETVNCPKNAVRPGIERLTEGPMTSCAGQEDLEKETVVVVFLTYFWSVHDPSFAPLL